MECSIKPFSYVGNSLWSVIALTVSLGLSLDPTSIIVGAINLSFFSFAMEVPLAPLAFIVVSVRPLVFSLAMGHIVKILTLVVRAIGVNFLSVTFF